MNIKCMPCKQCGDALGSNLNVQGKHVCNEVRKKEYKRRMRFARPLAKLAWCDDKTKEIPMNDDLVEAFARILVVPMYSANVRCATTMELLDEIKERVDLNYRTIK